ncbi:sugar transporter [Lutimaribacter sp. EGI FJ00013]|uniref:Sugar transporter n=1 Tax=Lutimaribacter degradans TaxID=2945989 RepID=A0ACC6A085_9RHOB|nr:sugar transporter [Lutimaribacter sp. EGI FJ00013]MCM2563863.1 sugar transporter [Lutimaribacter sp. EGI FJ00013]
MAEPARMKTRHWALIAGFVACVILPLVLLALYLWLVAEDQYASTTGFTVRQEEGASATDLLGGLASLTGASGSADGDVLYEYTRSQAVVRRIDEKLGLRDYYARYWSRDPVFALWPDASIEDLHWFWDRIVRVSFDQSTGLTELRVLAFDPEMARNIATEVVRESQKMVNALNEAARLDAIRYAEADLEQAQERLKEARAALTRFRTRTQIVDLESDIQGRMGVMSTLQQQLAAELVAFDELSQTTQGDDPRMVQALRRIQVIRDRIAEERRNFATTEVLSTGEDYPTLISEFEGLTVEREFAEETYRAALTAWDSAKAEAQRQTRYLAAYIEPTLAEEPEYPQRFMIFGLAALILTLGWGILALVYYSLRDRA